MDLNIESKLFHCIVPYITMLLKIASMLMQAVMLGVLWKMYYDIQGIH